MSPVGESGSEGAASDRLAAEQHLVAAAREAARVPDLPGEVDPLAVERVAVIGAGTMGRGIAMACADAGLGVRLVDVEPSALDSAVAKIAEHYAGRAARGRISGAEAEACRARIEPGADAGAAAGADLVVEAVIEDLDTKRAVFRQLDARCRPEAVLATNTSTLDIDAIGAAVRRPERVVGLHFFSPAQVMRLLEVVRGERTGVETLVTALAVAKRLKKTAVVARSCYGFIGNRMLESYGREANAVVLEGASPQQVDAALEGFGMAMGPFATFDMAGTDVGLRAHRAAWGRLPDDPRYFAVSHRVAELGRFGQKTGAGVYRYEPGSRQPLPDPEVEALIESEARRLGVERRPVSDDEIVERCLYPMVDEAARILEEGVAIRPGDVDVVWTTGYGFPAWRGGPLFYADRVGLDHVRWRLEELGRRLGNPYGYWTPSRLLTSLAESGRRFADWRAEPER